VPSWLVGCFAFGPPGGVVNNAQPFFKFFVLFSEFVTSGFCSGLLSLSAAPKAGQPLVVNLLAV
jgi:hypothetical protein